MNFLQRLFKVIQSMAHSLLSKFEDPIKLAEQAIRDLKSDYDMSMRSLAEVKSIAISTKRGIEEKTNIAKDYEDKALKLIQKAQNGELSAEQADRLASEALTKKQTAINDAKKLALDLKNYEAMSEKMENKITTLKDQITNWEQELQTLKARHKVAKTTAKLNKQMVSLSGDSAQALLESSKTKVQEEESLAQAYDEMQFIESDIDKEINAALGSSYSSEVQAQLAQLKTKMLPGSTNDNLADLKKEIEEHKEN